MRLPAGVLWARWWGLGAIPPVLCDRGTDADTVRGGSQSDLPGEGCRGQRVKVRSGGPGLPWPPPTPTPCGRLCGPHGNVNSCFCSPSFLLKE